jgi:hypothetical protein
MNHFRHPHRRLQKILSLPSSQPRRSEGKKLFFREYREALQNFLKRLAQLSISKGEFPIGLETPASFLENLCSHLKENGSSVVLLNPCHTNVTPKNSGKEGFGQEAAYDLTKDLSSASREAAV